jgi:hypothetical protein
MRIFFGLRFWLIVLSFTFAIVIPAVQSPPVMPAPLPQAQPAASVAPTPATILPVASTPKVTPSAPAPTPARVAMPGSVVTPAVPAPAPAPATAITKVQPNAPAATNATPSASTVTVAANEKEFDELYQKLNQVAGIKKELKRQLAEIEEKLDLARKMAIESKETSFKIIQQSKTPEAEALVVQVEKNLQSLTEIQKKLSSVDLPKFEEDAKKIQGIMQAVQAKMTDLESKGLKLQISQAQLELQKQSSLAKDATMEKFVAQAPEAKPQAQKTFSRKIYERTISLIASAIGTTKKTWQGFKKWVYSRPEESSSGVKKNSKPIDLASDVAIKNLMAEFDGILKMLDEMQISILQKYTNIKSKAKNLDIILRSNDDIRKHFELLDEQNPEWRETAINAFGAVVDGVYTIGKAIKKTGNLFYDKLIKGFVVDVKGKIAEQETQPDKPLDSQNSQVLPPSPEMQVPVVK